MQGAKKRKTNAVYNEQTMNFMKIWQKPYFCPRRTIPDV